jgi:hypothetical protein
MDRIRIGLISDTHEAAEPLHLVAQLASLGCDYHVHMGDIGGSWEITNSVRRIKQDENAVAALAPGQRRLFEALLAEGWPVVRAYLHTVLPQDPESSAARLDEAFDNYVAITRGVRALPNAVIMSGNTDRLLMGHPGMAALFRDPGQRLLVEPGLLDFGARAVVFWPSLRARPEDADRLEAIVDRFVEALRGKRQVAVIGHEQLFKGPVPDTYRRNVRAAGFECLTIPHYEPSRSWCHLIRLFRQLDPKVETIYLHGHVHDPDEVLGSGAPYLRRPGGLFYRLFGAGMAPAPGERRNGTRRTVPTNCVPLDRVALLTLDDAINFEVLPAP